MTQTVFVQLLEGNVQKAEFDFLVVEGSRVAVNASDWKIKTKAQYRQGGS